MNPPFKRPKTENLLNTLDAVKIPMVVWVVKTFKNVSVTVQCCYSKKSVYKNLIFESEYRSPESRTLFFYVQMSYFPCIFLISYRYCYHTIMFVRTSISSWHLFDICWRLFCLSAPLLFLGLLVSYHSLLPLSLLMASKGFSAGGLSASPIG